MFWYKKVHIGLEGAQCGSITTKNAHDGSLEQNISKIKIGLMMS